MYLAIIAAPAIDGQAGQARRQFEGLRSAAGSASINSMGTRLQTLVALLQTAPGEIFIQPHDAPDPDAIASAFGLHYLLSRHGLKARIIYGREYEKMDARRMVALLGIELSMAAEAASIESEDWVVVIDGQSGNTNMADLHCVEVAAIDHHVLRADASYRFLDIRPEVGSCSAIIADYFFENQEIPPRLVATALLYGIFIDTDSMTRGVTDLDALMFYRLYAFAEPEIFRRLRSSQLTLRDMATYADAFRTVEVYGRLAFLRLADADDSLVGAANDIVLSLDEIDASIAYSVRSDGVKISVRCKVDDIHGDELARAIAGDLGFGGGHVHMAGGFIPADRVPPDRSIDTLIRHRAISYMESNNH